MKGEWPPVDQVMKQIEKAIAAGGEDVNTTPLAGLMDPVSINLNIITTLQQNLEQIFKSICVNDLARVFFLKKNKKAVLEIPLPRANLHFIDLGL